MNKFYNVIWNDSLQTFVAVGEYSRSMTGKSRSRHTVHRNLIKGLILFALLTQGSPPVYAEGYSAGSGASAGSNDNAVAVGNTATVTDSQPGTAIGGGANAASTGSSGAGTAVGNQTSVTGANMNLAVTRTDGQGYNVAGTYSGTALGSNATSMDAGTALGSGSTADDAAVAVGIGAYAGAEGSVALGAASYASAPEAIGIGRNSVASGNYSIALGNVSTATGEGSVALGNSSMAAGPRSIALGSSSVDTANQDTTTNTRAAGADAIALGTSASADQTNSIAIGTSAHSYSLDSLAIGANASASGNTSMALGSDTIASTENSVALGNRSVTSDAHNGNYVINGSTTTAAGTVHGVVSIGDVGTERQIQNVAPGVLAANSTDAVNGSQLFATNSLVEAHSSSIATNTGNLSNVATALGGGAAISADGTWTAPSYTVQNGSYSNVGDALGALDNATTSNSTAITALQGQLGSGGTGLVQQDSASRAITVGAATDGTSVSFANSSGSSRTLTGVSAGALAADSTDAVNGSQLFATNSQVEANTAGIATNTTNIASNTNDIATNATNIASNTNDIATNTGNLSNVATALGGGAAISANGTWTAPSYTVQNGSYSNVGDALGALDNATTSNSTAITALQGQLGSGGTGLVQQDSASRAITVGAATDGTSVSFANSSGSSRTLTGVSAGALAADSTDAVNGSQLFATNSQVEANTAGIATNTTNIASNTNDIATNTTNIVSNTNDIATNTTNIVSNTNDIATNTGNLSNVATALGGGAAISANGTWTAPSYTVQNGSYSNVGDALGALDNATTSNSTAITTLQDQINSGGTGLVQQDTASRAITVGAATDGTSVSFANSSGSSRTLTGVSAGALAADSTDAINGSQLFATNSAVSLALGGGSVPAANGSITAPSYSIQGNIFNNVGDALASLNNSVTSIQQEIDSGNGGGDTELISQEGDGSEVSIANESGGSEIDVAGTEGTRVISGVAGGVDGDDAATIAQLNALSDQIGGANKYLSVNADENAKAASSTGQNSMAIGANAQSSADRGTAVGNDASTSGTSATAVGTGASASGVNSLALGAASQATHANSVALGGNSVTDRANSVSVGSAGNERQITNVAPGTAATDAVNLGQLEGMQAQTNSAFRQLDKRINRVEDKLTAGIASSMAMAGIPQAYQPSSSLVGAAVSGYSDKSAVAVGMSKISDDGKWITKLQASANTESDFGASLGVGYQW